MKKDKGNGKDIIPAEVWANSANSLEDREVLFGFLLQKIWSKEEVSENLTVCIFIMIYKLFIPL